MTMNARCSTLTLDLAGDSGPLTVVVRVKYEKSAIVTVEGTFFALSEKFSANAARNAADAVEDAIEAAMFSTDGDKYESDCDLGSISSRASSTGLHADFLDEAIAAISSRDPVASTVELGDRDTAYWSQNKKNYAGTVEKLHPDGYAIRRK